ncbi:helix-turn-helix transcriptional regulator [Falsihalocynthiibacter sp. CO-5D18]|uniref:helix-turn-helix transcriptional regulator n=1 Tax=Falsihalocynthiibacter sp. CO-5D18 TaxID=3240872 RepID=UPI003510556A
MSASNEHKSTQAELFDDLAIVPDAPVVPAERSEPPFSTLAALKTPQERPVISIQAAPAKECFLSVRDVGKRYSVSRQTIWRWSKNDPAFPKPVNISMGTTRWRLADLQRYEASLKPMEPSKAGGPQA